VHLIGLPAAVQFLTRVPVRLRREPDMATAVPWFPVVGALVGAAVGGTAAGLWHVTSPLVAATVAVLVGVLVTGAFHEDGLADVADAFAGGWTVERRLEILKDPRHGSYGVAALSGSILVRAVALAAIAGPAAILWSAIAAHVLGRGAAVAAMGVVPVARPEGLGADVARSLPAARSVVGVIAAAILAAGALVARFGFGGDVAWPTVAALAATVGATALVALLAHRKIGGLTGDVLGTVEQVTECAVLVVLASRWH
jgi:adenosylcobinamide-GDP ribazoletransferase